MTSLITLKKMIIEADKHNQMRPLQFTMNECTYRKLELEYLNQSNVFMHGPFKEYDGIPFNIDPRTPEEKIYLEHNGTKP